MTENTILDPEVRRSPAGGISIHGLPQRPCEIIAGYDLWHREAEQVLAEAKSPTEAQRYDVRRSAQGMNDAKVDLAFAPFM